MFISKRLQPHLLCARLAFVCLGISSTAVFAQQTPSKSVPITDIEKSEVIHALMQNMTQKYVFPEVAKKLNIVLADKLKKSAYAKVKDAKEFAKIITQDLQAETHDKHLNLEFEEENIPIRDDKAETSAEEKAKEAQEEITFMKAVNFGIERIERLPGNIAYIDYRGFGTTEIVGTAINAAMQLVHASDALIIDLRKNRGGSPNTVALFASYFLPAETHLNDIYNREKNTTTQMWTSAYTASPRYDATKKVYVLTSKDTFSAAEDLAYTLQSQKRSITVGEVTGGGAHPVESVRLSAHLMGIIPVARSISPVTHSNWEGVGVIPEMKTDANEALKIAQLDALTHLLKTETHPGKKSSVERALTKLSGTETQKK